MRRSQLLEEPGEGQIGEHRCSVSPAPDLGRSNLLEEQAQLLSHVLLQCTRQIAEAADINEALIFRHFKTKEDLYWSVLEDRIERRQLLEQASPLVNAAHALHQEALRRRLDRVALGTARRELRRCDRVLLSPVRAV